MVSPTRESEQSLSDIVKSLEKKRELESQVRDMLKRDGLLPKMCSPLRNEDRSFFVPLGESDDTGIPPRRPPRRLESLNVENKSKFTLDDRLTMADILHQEALKEKSEAAKQISIKVAEARERRNKESMEKRNKIEEKHRQVEERSKSKYVRRLPSISEKVDQAHRRREAKEKEMILRIENKIRRHEERIRSASEQPKISWTAEKQAKVLLKREKILRDIRTKFEEKMLKAEEARKRREEILKKKLLPPSKSSSRL